jgi:hypothetical protein
MCCRMQCRETVNSRMRDTGVPAPISVERVGMICSQDARRAFADGLVIGYLVPIACFAASLPPTKPKLLKVRLSGAFDASNPSRRHFLFRVNPEQ